MLLCIGLPPGAAAAAGRVEVTQSTAEKTLTARIKKWVSQGRLSKAEDDLEKLLAINPDSVQGWELQGRIRIGQERIQDAEQTIGRLEKLSGGKRGADNLRKLIDIRTNSKNSIYQARQLARVGRVQEAKAIWDEYFEGVFPDDALAIEYWDLVARVSPQSVKSEKAIKAILSSDAENLHYRLTSAIYRAKKDPADKGAIQVFKSLSDHPEYGREARKAWRDSMLRVEADKAGLALINAYLVQEPADMAVAERKRKIQQKIAAEIAWQNSPPMQAKRAGLQHLEEEQYAQAERELLLAYEAMRTDDEVSGGLGMLYVRTGQHKLARGYFQSALENTQYDQDKWKRMIQVAGYWGEVQDARKAMAGDDLEAAKQHLQTAMSIDPEEAEAPRLAAEIGALERQTLPVPDVLATGAASATSDAAQTPLAKPVPKQRYVLSTALDSLHRKGTAGVSDYTMLTVPVEVEYSGTYGRVFAVQAGWVKLDAGNLSASENAFGSMELCQPACTAGSLRQSANGGYLHGKYSEPGIAIDLGFTPTAFAVPSLVGGVEWEMGVGDLGVSLSYARRAMTSSLLAYAGSVDPNTGLSWGGVTLAGPKLSLSYDLGEEWGFWGNVGLFSIKGKNVLENSRSQLMGGVYRRIINSDQQEFTVGLNGMYWAHSVNAGEYTFGHGGYFSPAKYTSVSVPIEYVFKKNSHTFSAGTSLSYSHSRTDAELYYPTSPVLQSTSGNVFNASSGAGSGYSVKAKWEYAGTPGMVYGIQMSVERSSNYEPDNVLAYLNIALGRARASMPHRGPVKISSKY
jgi:tetratricopeptide (TPR) repeat protein